MSEVKVNKISPRTACGTVTLGDSGDTFTIPAGATINNQGTAVNFGATGSASWVTTVKTTDFTAVAGEGYFVNTTGGEIDVTLPAGTAGAVVAVADYANNFATANCILKQNGSDKIEGSTDDLVINQEGVSITLVFVDSTKGWVTTDTGNSTDVFESPSIIATGGTITNTPTCRIHTFTGPGTFCVSAIAANAANNEISYLIVGGGGGGGSNNNPGGPGGGGGGGAGGFREVKTPVTPYTASPLDGYGTPSNRVTVTAQGYSIIVDGGGAGGPSFNNGTAGGVSSGFGIISAGGGGGGKSGPGGSPNPGSAGGAGGSGGGGGGAPTSGGSGGAGNTPPVSPNQGFTGGNGSTGGYGGGSGGGATVVGYNAVSSPGGNPDAPSKSTGATTSINQTPTAFAGGGGGGGWCGGTAPGNVGGVGGGGQGAFGPFPAGATTATAGTDNTGGGGGGMFNSSGAAGKNGGSGIVIIRYKI